MTPELKSPSVAMPFDGFTQAMYAQKMIDEYKAAGVSPRKVFAQSFNLPDVLYWIGNEPEFGMQAVYLDDADTTADLPDLEELKGYAAQGVRIVAPPMWALVVITSYSIHYTKLYEGQLGIRNGDAVLGGEVAQLENLVIAHVETPVNSYNFV